MPGATVRLGAAHEVLPLAGIAPAIIRACDANRARPGRTSRKEASHANAAI
jgi:hypothetical protein